MTDPRRLSYANVAATLALILAVGGGGAAVAAGLAKNSVGSPQIKNGQVKTPDLAKNAVTGAKVKESSLVLDDSRIVGGHSSSPNATLTGDFQELATVTLKAPAAGVVAVLAQAEFRANETGTYLGGQLLMDGEIVSTFDWDPGDDDGLFDQTQSRSVALEVSKGTHEYTLQLRELGGVTDYSEYVGAQLLAQFAKSGTVVP